MQHIDEHTIELYVLGSETVKTRHAEIENHLEECAGCRSLFEKITQFYRQAESWMESEPDINLGKRNAVIRSNRPVPQYFGQPGVPIPFQSATLIGKLGYIVRRHPIMATMGSFASVALIFGVMILGGFFNKSASVDKRPTSYRFNPVRGVIEIYNKNNEILWDIISQTLFSTYGDNLESMEKLVCLHDLDGDGINEVIIGFPLGSQSVTACPLTILSADKQIISQRYFREEVSYDGRLYDDKFGIESVCCVNIPGQKNPGIIVTANNGRSPNIVFRLDNLGNILGEYVHFGHIRTSVLNWSDDSQKLYVYGENDLGEVDSLSFPIFAVLDPQKIIGISASSVSPGFGFRVSEAELFYLRFPLSDMNYLWNVKGYVTRMSQIYLNGKNYFSLWIFGSQTDSLSGQVNHPVFEYLVSDSMKVMETKFSSITLRMHNQLRDLGKVMGKLDQDYLENLKNGVRYWDGAKWQKSVTTVNAFRLANQN